MSNQENILAYTADAVSVDDYTPDGLISEYAAEEVAEQTQSTASLAPMNEGWRVVSGEFVFYQNGQRLRGIHELPSHLPTGNLHWFMFRADGVMVTGRFDFNGQTYFATDGVIVRPTPTQPLGSLASGRLTINGFTYFFLPAENGLSMWTGGTINIGGHF